LALLQAIVPTGLRAWFKQAKAAGMVVVATAIKGLHDTLPVEQGWVPRISLMQ